MKKITLVLITFLAINQCFSQSLYNRVWGKINSVIPKRIRVVEVKPTTEELFIVHESHNIGNPNPATYNIYGEIYTFNNSDSSTKLFYKFPGPLTAIPSLYSPYVVRIENIKFNNNEDLIVYGRTHNANLATAGTYSQTPITTTFSGFSFIAKISRNGQLLWFTYFHDLAQNASSLAIDKNNNIYVVSLRDKNDVLSSTSFQPTGDPSSNASYQNVISKLDTNGKHVWSTFYSKDNSSIKNVIASDNGIYIYGDHMGGNGSSNFFGTSNSYQEYSSGLSSNGDCSTVFVSKFNFNGSRIWSSYFGEQISKCPVNNSDFPYGMTVINDEVYILTDLKNIYTPAKNVSTNNTYLTTPISTFKNTTLTKFTVDGKRSFTTYLYNGSTIQKTSSNDLLITGQIASTDINLNNLTTQNAYQKQHGGKSDIYTYILSNNGSTLKYGSFYGFDGSDAGIAVTTKNGYYIFGNSIGNSKANTPFDNTGEVFFGSNLNGYGGNFISYFTSQPLSFNKLDKLNASIYPNPTTDVLNIQTEDIFPENTMAIVYDISGKQILTMPLQNLNSSKINVSNLNAGVYILTISNAEQNKSFKFIKN